MVSEIHRLCLLDGGQQFAVQQLVHHDREHITERVHKKEINNVSKHELDADEEWELNHRLYKLHCLTANSQLSRANMVCVSIEYFVVCTDEENDAYRVKGQYKTVTGFVLKVDPNEKHISIRNGVETHIIPFSDVYRIFKPTE